MARVYGLIKDNPETALCGIITFIVRFLAFQYKALEYVAFIRWTNSSLIPYDYGIILKSLAFGHGPGMLHSSDFRRPHPAHYAFK